MTSTGALTAFGATVHGSGRNPSTLLADTAGQWSYISSSFQDAALDAVLYPPSNPHDGNLPPTSRSYMRGLHMKSLGGETSINDVTMDMSILSAETHEDAETAISPGKKGKRAERSSHGVSTTTGESTEGRTPAAMEVDALSSQDIEKGREAGKGKGRRTRVSRRSDSHDDQSKKQRGRPRLDTKDETIADRRRTQIRLAQRAYRLRKETTISSLKKRVTTLERAVEDMNSAFLHFNNSLLGSGITQSRPELAEQLQAMTDRFSDLARNATPEFEHDDDQAMSPEVEQDSAGEEVFEQQTQDPTQMNDPDPSGDPSAVGPLGYQVSFESFDVIPQDVMDPERQETSEQPQSSNDPPSHYGIMDMQQYHALVPPVSDYGAMLQIPKQVNIKNKFTFSIEETTFARRLHRAALERGYYLLSEPQAHGSEIARVFKFSLGYSSLDQIRNVLRKVLYQTNTESLEIGHPRIRNGTMQDGANSGVYRSNLDYGSITASPAPSILNARSFAPIALGRTEEARGIGVTAEVLSADDSQYDNEWFDAYDVDWYLRGKGLHIEPQASFAEYEVSESSLSSLPSSPLTLSSSNPPTSSPTTPKTGDILPDLRGGTGFPFPEMTQDAESFGPTPSPVWNKTDTLLDDLTPTPILTPNATSNFPEIPYSIDSANYTGRTPGKRLASLNVIKFVDEVVKHGVCLGRSPGFRRSDVDVALRLASQIVF